MNKKFRFKKLAALLMVICCIASLCPVAAKGDESTDDGTNATESVTFEADDCTYDADSGSFSVSISLDFTFEKDSGTSAYYTGVYDPSIVTTAGYTVAYGIALPDGLSVPDGMIGISYNGYNLTGTEKLFEYYFAEGTDGDGNPSYSVVLVFSEDYIASLEKDTFDGTLNFNGYIDASLYDTGSGDLKIPYGTNDDQVIDIKKGEITWPGNETVTEDIQVKKSGKYDAVNGLITYTIIVYTELGTGDTITLSDYFADDYLADILGEMGTLTYQPATTQVRTRTSSNGETTDVWNDGTAVNGTAGEIAACTDDEAAGYPYYYYDEDGKLVIVLGGLAAADENMTETETDKDGNTTVTKQLDSWVITYTYEVNPESNTTYYSTNKVAAATHDDVADTDITYQTSATVAISGTTMLAKSGSYDNKGTITWTIVVGDGRTDLNGYILTDSMLAGMSPGSLTISGAAASGILYATREETEVKVDGKWVDTYEYTYYSDAELATDVTGLIEADSVSDLPSDASAYPIVILYELDDSDNPADAELAGIIFNGGTQYTIQYKTVLDSVWSSQYIVNGAELTYDGTDGDLEGIGYESTGSVWITGQGQNAFSKKNVDAAADADNGSLYTLTWTADYAVPSTGIPAGIRFTDYVSSSSGSGVHSITSAQAVDIIAAVKDAWGEDNITTIQFCTDSSYSDNRYSDANWVDADAIDSESDAVYYQFRFTTVYEVEYYDPETMTLTDEEQSNLDSNGYFTREETAGGDRVTKLYYGSNTVSYTYSTTSDVDGFDTNSYYNYLTDSYTTKTATWTWNEKVVKYGTTTSGYTSGSGTTKLTVTDADATVSWIVRVVPDGSSDTYTVTDTLPAGVTLSSLYVSTSGSSYGYEQVTVGESDGTEETTSITGMGTFVSSLTKDANGTDGDLTDDVYTVKLDVSELDSEVSMLYIKYVCSAANLKEASTTTSATSGDGKTTTYAIGGLTNTVDVTTDGDTPYGSSEETTVLTWKQEEEDTKELIKESEFDSNNNTLNYSVLINKDAATYTYEGPEGEDVAYDSLTVTDILSYYSYPMYGNVRSATLLTSSLKLYYATVDEDGTVAKGAPVPDSDYAWTLSEDMDANDWQEHITKTITLTVPNGTTMLLEYQYRITVVIDGTGWTDSGANVTNSAVLSAGGGEIYSTTPTYNNDKVQDNATSGSVSGNAGYAVYKVDEDNFNLKLSGAVFTLYVYDSGTGKFPAVGEFTTDSSGTFSVLGSLVQDADGNPYYSVPLQDGSTVSIPADTICYLRETRAPEGYRTDGTNYYFYFGSLLSTTASDCDGYDAEFMENVRNVISTYTNYITNAHSSDYYADRTSISVDKTWLDEDGNEQDGTDGSVTFDLYRVLVLNDGTITSVAEQEAAVDEAQQGTGTGEETGEGDDQEDDQEDDPGKTRLTWTVEDSAGVSASSTLAVEASAENPVEITLSFYWPGLMDYPDWWWYPIVYLYKGSDGSGDLLATFNEEVDWEDDDDSKIIYDKSGLVTDIWIDDTDHTYNFAIVLTENVSLYCNMDDFITNYADMSDLAATIEVTSGGTDAGTGADPGTEPETGQEPEEPETGTAYSDSEYRELMGSYTISAEDGWSWSSSDLPRNYLDTETFETLGYFVYFVEEHPIYKESGEPDEDGNYPLAYTTTYTNNSGITGGTIGITNQAVYVPKGSVTLRKVDSGDADKVLEGAVFTIYSDAECTEIVGTMTTDADGVATYGRLPLGTYWVRETQAPSGYTVASADPVEVELTEDGQVYDLGDIANDVDDTPVVERTGSITIKKYGPDGGTALSGVKFLCESVTDGIAYSMELTTGTDGTVKFEGLAAGTYTVTETATQSELTLLAEPITVVIPLELTAEEVESYGSRINLEDAVEKDGMYYFYDLTYEVTDGADLQLPASGGSGMPVVWVLLAVIFLLCGIGMLSLRKPRT